MRGPVRPWALQFQGQVPIAGLGEPIVRQRRPAHVATQVLEPRPIVGGYPRVRVEVEPFDLCAPSSLDLVAAPSPGRLTWAPSPPGQSPPRPGAHAQAYGRLGDRRQGWLVAATRVGVRILVVEDGATDTRHHG